MENASYLDEEPRQSGFIGLMGLIVGLALGALALYAFAGPPHLPSDLPSWEIVVLTLQGSSVPLEAVAYVMTTMAWMVWFWLVVSLMLRLAVVGADAVTRGAAWAKALRALSDQITLPIVRRLVDGAVVAIIVVNLAARSASSAAAASLMPNTAVAVVYEPARPQEDTPEAQQDGEQRAVEYTVQPGDTLWAIAERFYGTGYEYPRLVEANAGRQMPDGRRFTKAGVIHPGWVLLVPLPSHAVEEVGAHIYYVVEEGDTLRGIAARLLGDEARWRTIFDLNRGTARLEDGRVLRDPDLIWPGLRLRVPTATLESVDRPSSSPESSPARPGEVPAVVHPSFATTPEPTPAPASPTADATAVPVEPSIVPAPATAATPSVAVETEPISSDSALSPLLYGAAGMAAVGGAALLARRRVRRSLSEPPIPTEPEPPPSDDFAEAEFARALTHQLHGGEMEPVALVAQHALRFLSEHGLDDVAVITARQGRNSTALTLSTGLLAQPRLLELAERFASRLGGKALASLTPDHDVLLQIAGPKLVGLLTPSPDGRVEAPCLLPLGVLPKGDTVYANWHELGHVLIAGLPGGGAEVVLTSIIATLAAHCRPGELRLWTVASRRTLPAQLQHLPHQCCGLIDPGDHVQANRVLEHVRAELVRRMRAAKEDAGEAPTRRAEPEVVLVIGELDEVEDDGATLDLIGVHGPEHGVRLLAATTDAADLNEDGLAHFGTRLVLQTLDDNESIKLLGRPDAADLGSGDLLFRIDGRLPVRARGFRISADHLDELLRLMRGAYGDPPSTTAITAVGPDTDEDLVRPAGEGVPAGGPEGDSSESVAEKTGQPPSPALDHEASRTRDGFATSTIAEAVALAGAPAGGAATSDAVPAGVSPEEGQPSEGRRSATLLAEAAAIESGEPPASAEGGNTADGHSVGVMVSEATAAAGGPPDINDEPAAEGALVQVRCFGEFVVSNGDHEIEPSLDGRVCFKSFELLAFLASHADGAVSKDKLLAALWPDADAERAANRMRVEMARLRALLARQVPGLPAEAVRCERDGTCRLDTRLIASDVHEFLALCRAAPKLPPDQAKSALQRARAIYQGDLLTGRGARFYEWVDDPGETGVSLRAACREEYNRATLRLARMLCREGQFAQAVPLYRSLLKAEPTLEDVVRELYRCYRQLGDLSSLIREDRHLRQALREAYYDPEDPEDDPERYQPEPETVELFERICKELEGKVAAREDTHQAVRQR